MSRSPRAPAEPGPRVSSRWLVVGALIGAVAGLLWGLSDRPRYEAVATVIVTDGGHDARLMELAESEEVATAAAALLGDDVAGADLIARTTFSAADGAGTLVVRSTATSADFAAAAADAFATAVVELAGEREPGRRDPLQPGREAELPTAPEDDRRVPASTLVGAGAGAVLAGLLGLVGNIALRRSPRVGRPAGRLGVPELGVLTSVEDGVWAAEPGLVEIDGAARAELAALAEQTGLERPEWMPRALALAGLSNGVGPSRAIIGLAGVVAARGSRVVVLEADLGYPRLAPLLGIGNEPGLAEHLAGEAGPREVMRTIRVSEAAGAVPEAAFVCVPAGAAPTGRPHLVERRFADLVERLGRVYDLVLVLAPPLLDEPATRVAANVGEALICLEQGDAVALERERTTGLLEGTRLLGSVLLAPTAE